MARHVTAADLDQRITIQQPVDTPNALGEPVTSWQPLHSNIWAQRRPLTAREQLAAGKTQTPVDAVFRIRYRAGITASMRVVHNGQPYEIVGQPIDIDSAHITLEIMATAGVRDGR